MDKKIYLDHNATSPLLPEAQTAMGDAAEKTLGNPSSPHWAGRESKILLEEAVIKDQIVLFLDNCPSHQSYYC